jgi:hypothetical protein
VLLYYLYIYKHSNQCLFHDFRFSIVFTLVGPFGDVSSDEEMEDDGIGGPTAPDVTSSQSGVGGGFHSSASGTSTTHAAAKPDDVGSTQRLEQLKAERQHRQEEAARRHEAEQRKQHSLAALKARREARERAAAAEEEAAACQDAAEQAEETARLQAEHDQEAAAHAAFERTRILHSREHHRNVDDAIAELQEQEQQLALVAQAPQGEEQQLALDPRQVPLVDSRPPSPPMDDIEPSSAEDDAAFNRTIEDSINDAHQTLEQARSMGLLEDGTERMKLDGDAEKRTLDESKITDVGLENRLQQEEQALRGEVPQEKAYVSQRPKRVRGKRPEIFDPSTYETAQK